MLNAIRVTGLLATLLLGFVSLMVGQSTPSAWDVTIPRGQTRTIDFVTEEGTWMSVDVSPDGEWIVFDLLGHVYRVPATGGDAEVLTQDAGIAVSYHPRYSPDGNAIAFVSDRSGQDNLWIMNADGSDPRPVWLDDESRVAEPAWTPDGASIVATRRFTTNVGFYRTTDVIWKFPRAGGEGEELVRLEASGGAAPSRAGVWVGRDRAQWPSVSGDGRFAYFNASNFSGEDRHIRRINLETGRIERVTEPKAGYAACCGRPAYPLHLGEVAPEVSPDGRWLAFARKLPGGRTGLRDVEYMARTALWVRDLETGAERIVMDPITSSAMEFHPSWNARALPGYSWAGDGQSIVVSQGGKLRRVWVESGRVETIPFRARVHRVIGEMARARTRIDDDELSPRFIRWPVTSPGGSRLVFETAGQLWLMDAPNGTPRSLVDSDSGLVYTPEWSPDGEWVAFTTWSDVYGGHVWKVRPGRDPVRLTDRAGEYLKPTWSRDGTMLTVRWRDHALDDQRWQTGQVPAAGGRLEAVESPPPPVVPARALQPTVSPGDRWIAFQYELDVYVAPYSLGATQEDITGGMRRLSLEGGAYPHWRDATTLEFAGPGRVFTYDAESGGMDTVTIDVRLPRDVGRGRIALNGARVITVDEGGVRENATIVVSDGRITCVGACDTSRADTVIDAQGKTIMPGLFDVHAHFLMGGPLIPEHRWSSANYLAYGITTTHDPSAAPDPSFPIGELVEAGRLVGPRTYSTGVALTCGPHSPIRQIETYDDAARIVNTLADMGALSLKDYKQCTRRQRQMLTVASQRRGVTLTSENSDLVYILGLIMDGHTGWEHPLQYVPIYSDVARFIGQAGAHYSPDLILSDYPQGNALEYWLGVDDLWRDEKVLEWNPWQRVAARRSFVKKPPREFMFPVLAHGAADIMRAGGRVAVGAHGEQPGLGTHWELWTLGVAMTPLEVLTAATMHSAHFLGLEHDLGSIANGKIADLVVLNSNPLDDLRNTTDIALVMKAGTLYDAGTLDRVWPERVPYGPHPWTNDFIRRTDLRGDEYWDRRPIP